MNRRFGGVKCAAKPVSQPVPSPTLAQPDNSAIKVGENRQQAGGRQQDYAPFVIAATDQATAILTGQFNLIYRPIPMIDLGVELQYGRKTFRRALSLDDADALRLGFGTWIKFN